ncbi:hypothetical protein [Acrocarpospora sp. B8E8]|uniref:hypothetical protein n=1 Tax=Acrocarpospora sp. B8E8 TaxID=3153572 RepID=UPI00325EA632
MRLRIRSLFDDLGVHAFDEAVPDGVDVLDHLVGQSFARVVSDYLMYVGDDAAVGVERESLGVRSGDRVSNRRSQ